MKDEIPKFGQYYPDTKTTKGGQMKRATNEVMIVIAILIALLLICLGTMIALSSCAELPTQSPQPIDGQHKWHKHTERPLPGDTTTVDLYSK
jgi:hypothetical protein